MTKDADNNPNNSVPEIGSLGCKGTFRRMCLMALLILCGLICLAALAGAISLGIDALKAGGSVENGPQSSVLGRSLMPAISLLIGLTTGLLSYWLFQQQETLEISLLTNSAEFQSSNRLSWEDIANRIQFPSASALRRNPIFQPALRNRGIGMIVIGVVHLIVPHLVWQVGIILILLGFLNFVFPLRIMFVVNGLLLCGIGSLNAIGGRIDRNIFWSYFGTLQFLWGMEEIGLFHKLRPRLSFPALDETMTNISDPKEKVATLLGVFWKYRGLDIRYGVLSKLVDLGEHSVYAIPYLRLYLKAPSVSQKLKDKIHSTLQRIEGSL